MKVFLKIVFSGIWLFSGISLWGSTAFRDSLGCDSIFLRNGEVFLAQDLSWNDTALQYVKCRDRWKTIHSLRRQEVKRIKKADGMEVFSPLPPDPERPLTEAEQALEADVLALSKTSKLILPFLLLGGLGLFLIPVVFVRAARLTKKLTGHPHQARLLQRIERAKKRAWGVLIGYLVVAGLFFWAVISFFAQFEHR